MSPDPDLPGADRLAELAAAERRARLANAHARRHLGLLAQGSRALVASLDDPIAALRTLVEVIVPGFADWCAIDMVENGAVKRVAYRHADPGAMVRFPALVEQHPDWPAPIRRVMASGHFELVWDAADPKPPLPGDDDHRAVLVALGLESCVIVPLRIQGLSVGAITCATAPARRGYRPSDVEALEELAGRTATTLERISLYQAQEAAAREAAARAGQLRRLTEAARAVQPQRQANDVAVVVLHQARRVLDSRIALMVVEGQRTRLRMGSGPHGWEEEHDRLLAQVEGGSDGPAPSVLSAPMNDRSGAPVGLLAVGGKTTGEFTGEDEAILVSLAQMASVAIANANLYESVRSGEQQLLALVEAAPLAILDLGLTGEVRRFNTAAQRLLGKPGASGAATEITFHPETAAVLRRLVADTAAGQSVTDLEAVALRADGAEVPLSLA
ncbi:MAG: GAF domain-containing protein, partial [Acidimicrobiia bacterium]